MTQYTHKLTKVGTRKMTKVGQRGRAGRPSRTIPAFYRLAAYTHLMPPSCPLAAYTHLMPPSRPLATYTHTSCHPPAHSLHAHTTCHPPAHSSQTHTTATPHPTLPPTRRTCILQCASSDLRPQFRRAGRHARSSSSPPATGHQPACTRACSTRSAASCAAPCRACSSGSSRSCSSNRSPAAVAVAAAVAGHLQQWQ